MSAKDVYHTVVKKALEKNNWRITHDPLFIRLAEIGFYIDLGAERLLGAEKNGEKIAVEVKSFQGTSTVSEFHTALGQFMNYRLALEEEEPDRKLYLAVPKDIYHSFFRLRFGQLAIHRYQLKIIVYDVRQEVITQWVK